MVVVEASVLASGDSKYSSGAYIHSVLSESVNDIIRDEKRFILDASQAIH